jgi:hypothetical protein
MELMSNESLRGLLSGVEMEIAKKLLTIADLHVKYAKFGANQSDFLTRTEVEREVASLKIKKLELISQLSAAKDSIKALNDQRKKMISSELYLRLDALGLNQLVKDAVAEVDAKLGRKFIEY